MPIGFTPPYSPTGRSSLVPPPPWHYAGQVFSLAFETDIEAAKAYMPEGFGKATGRAFVHFCDWQATSDGSELLDPVYSQYKEFFVLLEAERDGGTALYCPFIYVDQDISLVRGLMQGWPKKLGSVWMTRSHDLDHPAAARRQKGTRLGATLAVKDRRLVEAALTLDGEPGKRLGFLAAPFIGVVASPTIVGQVSPGTPRLVRATVPEVLVGPLMGGTAELALFQSARDELAPLAPKGPVEAAVGALALTITGAVAVD